MYIYIPELLAGVVSGEPARHLFSLRVTPGQILTATNLRGQVGQIEIVRYSKENREISYKLLANTVQTLPRSNRILVQALIDKHYIEKLLEVAPLANIQHIYFYPSARSNLTRLSLDRFVGILTRASELAEKAWRPDVTLLDPTQGQDLIQKVRPVVMEFDPTQTLSSDIENSAVLVGPEGGWTADELAWFKQLGLTFVSLANGVLPAWIAGYSWFAK